MYQLVEKNIVLKRGPHWWLAWMSHTPGRVFKGRSSAEAVGRLIMTDASAIGFGIPVTDGQGYPLDFFNRPLSPGDRDDHLADVAKWRVDPKYTPVGGKRAA